MLEDFAEIVNRAEAGRLGAQNRTAGADGLAADRAKLGSADQTAILAIEVADLTAAAAEVAGGAVDILTDVAIELGHKCLAETHHFGVGLAAGIEVAAALGAADRQAGQSILIDLLEAEEFNDREIDRRIETQAALIRTKGRVVLHAVAAVDVVLAVVIHPGHAELDGALGLDHPLQQAGLLIFGMRVDHRAEGRENLFNGLQKLRLIGVLLFGLVNHSLDISVHNQIASSNFDITVTNVF